MHRCVRCQSASLQVPADYNTTIHLLDITQHTSVSCLQPHPTAKRCDGCCYTHELRIIRVISFYQHQRLILFAMDRICAAPEEFEGCSLTGGQTLCICLAVISSGSKVLSKSNGATCRTKREHLQPSAVTHQAQSDITPSHRSNKATS